MIVEDTKVDLWPSYAHICMWIRTCTCAHTQTDIQTQCGGGQMSGTQTLNPGCAVDSLSDF